MIRPVAAVTAKRLNQFAAEGLIRSLILIGQRQLPLAAQDHRVERARRAGPVRLFQFFSGGDLSGLQKGFDEFAFAANGHAGNFF